MISPFDSICHVQDGSEFWMARDLMGLLDYARWSDFGAAIDRAIISCKTHGEHVGDHFSRIVTRPEGAGRPKEDYKLSRKACYLIAMASDSRKKSVADSQNYFYYKIREAELAEQQALPSVRQVRPSVRQVEPALPAQLASVKGVPPLIEFPVIGGRTLGDKDAVRIAFEGLQVATYLLTMVNVVSKDPALKFRISTTSRLLWDLINGAGYDIKSLVEQTEPPN